MKGLSQTLKDLALTNQTDFSRFLWSASLVSRVEFDEGCLILPTTWSGGTRGEAPIIFKPNWDPNGRKKIFWRPQPLHLRVRMTAPLPYLDPPVTCTSCNHTFTKWTSSETSGEYWTWDAGSAWLEGAKEPRLELEIIILPTVIPLFRVSLYPHR